MKKLNLGCGKDIRDGWINLDYKKLSGVDVVHDLTELPLPFKDNTFNEILCKDIFEHIDYVPLLKEIHRILKPGAKLTIMVPHFTSKDAFADPTHRRYFAVGTFRYFTRNHYREYYFDFSFSEIERIHINFDKRLAYFYNYLLEFFVNLCEGLQNLYEGSILRTFPATNLEVILIK